LHFKKPTLSKQLFVLTQDSIIYAETRFYQKKFEIIRQKNFSFENLRRNLAKLKLKQKASLCIPVSMVNCKLLPIDHALNEKEMYQYINEAVLDLFGKKYDDLYIDYQLISEPLTSVYKKSGQRYLQMVAAKKSELDKLLAHFSAAKIRIKNIETTGFALARLACHLVPENVEIFTSIFIWGKTFFTCVIEQGCLLYAKQSELTGDDTSEIKQAIQIFKTLYPHTKIQKYFLIQENVRKDFYLDLPCEKITIENPSLLWGLTL